jgi:hypothetical protein
MTAHNSQDKISFDDFRADDELVRTIFFRRLKSETNWNELGLHGWETYVTFVNNSFPMQLLLRATRVYWQLVGEGILHPGRLKADPNVTGLDLHQFQPPYFSLTPYGAEVVAGPSFEPHYPKSYMTDLLAIGNPDKTVIAYMQEAVDGFRRGSLTASMVMLGVAAERVFIQVCESVLNALASQGEQAQLSKLMEKTAMKAKLEWVSKKLHASEKELPDGSSLLVLSMYNLVRLQRNELGHPQDAPPRVPRAQARAYLKMFPPSYAKAQEVRSRLEKIKI